jgi:hypothetical protein
MPNNFHLYNKKLWFIRNDKHMDEQLSYFKLGETHSNEIRVQLIEVITISTNIYHSFI